MERLKVYKGEATEQEAAFLHFFYARDSETKFDVKQSAMKAGYPETKAENRGRAVIRKFGYSGAKYALEAVGVTKPYLAMKLKNILETAAPKDQIPAIRMSWGLLGEATSGEEGGQTFNAPVMIIQGMTQSRMKALREAIPQLSPEKAEELSNERSTKNLEAFKRGELGFISGNSKAQKVSNLDGDDDKPSGKSETPAG